MYEQVIIVGSGKFAFQCALRVKQVHPVVSVFEYKASGLSVLERLCGKNDIVYQLLDKKQMKEALLKQASKKTLIVSAFNTYLFPSTVVNEENFTIVNYHNAYLPFHRGRNAEAWAIYEEDDFSGATWHLVDSGVDTGAIIAQEKIFISESMTSLELMQKQNELAYQLFDEFVEELLKGNIFGRQNSETEVDENIHYSWETPNNGELNLAWSIQKMSCFLRAMDYGILGLLGESKVFWNGICYKIKSYKLDSSIESETISFNENVLLIVKEGKRIALRLEVMGEVS